MLTYAHDFSIAGRMRVQGTSAAALAAVPDAIVQHVGLRNDLMACWALHPSEQDGLRHDAYIEERREVPGAQMLDVVEVLRPRQQNVVWVDRYHLVLTGAPAATASRLLGLYVGSQGRMLLYVYPPESSFAVAQQIGQAPHSGTQAWDAPALISQTRFGLLYDPASPGTVQLSTSPVLAQPAAAALDELARLTAQWN